MFDVEKITINAAFYELYENVFKEDFFTTLAALKPNPRIQALRQKNEADLTEEEADLLLQENLKLGGLMRKYTPRIAYIGTKLYKRDFNVNQNDYMNFLTSCDASDFLNPEIIQKVWEKITLDQSMPKSVKNV